MFVVQREQGPSHLLGHCRIHRIGPTQPVLGRQRSGLVTQSFIQRHDGYIRQPSQGRRECFCLHWLIAGPTDGSCDFGQHQVWHDDGQRPHAEHLEELATGGVAGFPLVKPVDPHADIYRIHDITGAAPVPLR